MMILTRSTRSCLRPERVGLCVPRSVVLGPVLAATVVADVLLSEDIQARFGVQAYAACSGSLNLTTVSGYDALFQPRDDLPSMRPLDLRLDIVDGFLSVVLPGISGHGMSRTGLIIFNDTHELAMQVNFRVDSTSVGFDPVELAQVGRGQSGGCNLSLSPAMPRRECAAMNATYIARANRSIPLQMWDAVDPPPGLEPHYVLGWSGLDVRRPERHWEGFIHVGRSLDLRYDREEDKDPELYLHHIVSINAREAGADPVTFHLFQTFIRALQAQREELNT